jgi:hypothetical protein
LVFAQCHSRPVAGKVKRLTANRQLIVDIGMILLEIADELLFNLAEE